LCGKAECGINRHIRGMCFRRLEELSFSYYDTTPVGYIISRMTSDTSRLGDTIAWGLIDLFWSVAYLVITATTMFILNWKLALLVLAVVPVIAVAAVWFQKRILEGYRTVRKTNSKITGAFNEGIMGAKTTKTLVREKANCEEFGELTGTMRRSSIRAAVLSALFMPIVTCLGSLASALVLWNGGNEVISAAGILTIGTLAAFQMENNEAEEQGLQPSIVLRRMEKGESLWDIAKAYRTTVEEIQKANGGESLGGESMLLIPRTR
jgi:ATP-binding cassette subfamily B protein